MARVMKARGVLLGLIVAAALLTAASQAAAQDCHAGSGCVSVNCVECRWWGGGSPEECVYTYGSANCGCSWIFYYGGNQGYGCSGVGYCDYGGCSGRSGPGCSPWEPLETPSRTAAIASAVRLEGSSPRILQPRQPRANMSPQTPGA
jgi:hypothetical protein